MDRIGAEQAQTGLGRGALQAPGSLGPDPEYRGCERVFRRDSSGSPEDRLHRRNREGMTVIDTVLHLLFRCAHRHITRPFTPLGEAGVPRHESNVVCLDCTRQFTYDLNEMRIGQMIERSHDACVLPPGMPRSRETKLAYTLGVAVPLAVLVGAGMRVKKQVEPEAEQGRSGAR